MKTDVTMLVCATIVLIAAFLSIAVYHINSQYLMARNIDNAITKGIDPIAVRCSYARENDVVCVAFAASGKEVVIQSNVSKK